MHSQLLQHWGANSGDLKDLKMFIELLGEHDDLAVAHLCAKLTDRKAELKASPAAKSKAKPTVDLELVDSYLGRFKDAALSRAEQLAIVDELKKDKRGKLPELVAIANALTESGVTYSKKPAALDALTTWINRKFDTERRLQDTHGIF